MQSMRRAFLKACISLSRPIPYSLNLVPRALFPTSTSKAREKRPGNEVATPFDSSIKPFEREISGFEQSLLWVRKYSIYYSYVSEQDFSTQNTCTLSGYLESLHAVVSHHPFCSWVFKLYRITCYCCGCLYYCTCSFRKKETHLFLTTEWRVVQSSWSILEQYMGRWPKAIIQGLLARFSGLFASLRSFVNHSTCSATAPLVK